MLIHVPPGSETPYSFIDRQKIQSLVLGTLLLLGRRSAFLLHGALTLHFCFGVNLLSVREIAAAYTQGISKSVYRLWPTRMEAYRSFQLALVLGTLRLLPSP